MTQSPCLQNALYIVATPLGNLRDITLRALDVLRHADVLFCEDTRRTRTLLTAYGIAAKKLYSYRDDKNDDRTLLNCLTQGHSVALVSDAGTPLIADPGYHAVQHARAAGYAVVPVAGASAVIAALSAAGMPSTRFTFMGFVPTNNKDRQQFFGELATLSMTAVFFDTPHRLLSNLQQAAQMLPQRRLIIARELTKMYEEFVEGTPQELYDIFAQRPAIKGEFVLLLDAAPRTSTQVSDTQIIHALKTVDTKHSPRDAIALISTQLSVPRKRVYALAIQQHTHDRV